MPLPDKPKRKGESEFEHKIRQWSEEVKDRPERFPGGQDQAIAIAAKESGVSKNIDEDPLMELMDQIAKSECKHGIAGMCKMCGYDDNDLKKDYNNQKPPPMANPTWATGVSVPDGTSADNAKDSPLKLGPRGGKFELKDGKKEYVKSILSQARDIIKKAGESAEGTAADVVFAPTVLVNISPGEVESEGVDAKEGVEKALNSRSLVITPAMIRNMDVFRSATTQTSRMYTGLAHDVSDTLNHLAIQNGPATKAQDATEKRTQEIEEIRRNISNGVIPKEDIGPINVGNHRK